MSIVSFRFLLSVVLTACLFAAVAQDQRTTTTRIADALALLPAKDKATAATVHKELMALGDEGLATVISGVRPSGDPLGVPYRYAIDLIAFQSSTKEDKAKVEGALVKALGQTNSDEVKGYFIQSLAVVGSSQSLGALSDAIRSPKLAEFAIGTLQAIGSQEARGVLRDNLAGATEQTQRRIIRALGELRDTGSVEVITTFSKTEKIEVRKEALWALARIGEASSEAVLLEQARLAGFRVDPSGAMDALVEYMNRRREMKASTAVICMRILDNTTTVEQQYYRLAALRNLTMEDPLGSPPVLVKELDRWDIEYQREVLRIATLSKAVFGVWENVYKKSKGDRQAEVLAMMARGSQDPSFTDRYLLPALDSRNVSVRIVALKALAATKEKKYADPVAAYLTRPNLTTEERDTAGNSFLQLADDAQVSVLARNLEKANPAAQVAILKILASRRDVNDGKVVLAMTKSADVSVRTAAFDALPSVVSSDMLKALLAMVPGTSSTDELNNLRMALMAIASPATAQELLKAVASEKQKLLPILPYIPDPGSLAMAKEVWATSKDLAAFEALINWQNGDAAASLLAICKDQSLSTYHEKAFGAYVRQVMKTSWPDDQKLLKLREIFPLASTADQRRLVIRESGGVRTFLSFVFAASYLDDAELGTTASRSVMRLALPTADAKPGLTGMEVRKAIGKVLDKLTGPDSQYDRIDVKTYLDNLPYTSGFEPIFNGKDLTGWHGLVENPIARSKMTKAELDKKQAAADATVATSWTVRDGVIHFNGAGDNLCTVRSYGDFELLVDYRIPKIGDSGIYLRGTPQVQIWDISRVADGAQVGSGGLYNNTVNNRIPLAVADNPVEEWNTLRITMIGDRVTVYLNGVLVVDNVVMENYWDRSIPIFAEGPIELQAHGADPAFRNIYVRELNNPFVLSAEEKQQSFEVLFDGGDLSNWVGNKTDYVVDDHVLAIFPTGAGKGNLYTAKEYSNFIFRFEFQLTPAGNNGLGIHAPREGDAAYVGKEIQILDDGHPAYAAIKPYQAHGSVYGVIPAKRGFLRPTGEWNREEVEVRGDYIKVTLNGTVILEGDMRKASRNGTIDKQDHPGLNRHTGHIGFLGHGSVVRFRNIRIKDLGK